LPNVGIDRKLSSPALKRVAEAAKPLAMTSTK
jgi:hypothetical protein